MKIKKGVIILTLFMVQFILSNGVSVAENSVKLEQQKDIEYATDTNIDTSIENDPMVNTVTDNSLSTNESQELDTELYSLDFQMKSESRAFSASGTWGTANWELDDAGVLHIYEGTFADTLINPSGDPPFSPWADYSSSINKIVFEGTVVAAKDSSALFHGLQNLETIENLNKLDTSNVLDMSFMFYRVDSLTSLDVSGFDTSNVTNMSYMFYGFGNLTSLDVSGFDTNNVTNMSYMFYGLSSLRSLDVSGFDTRNVTSMRMMFSNTSSLTNIDVSNFNTQNVTDMSFMFMFASSLTNLDLSSFDTQNVTIMIQMLAGTSSLSRLSLGINFNFIDGQAELPPITKDGYTGRWVGLTEHMIFNSSTNLMTNFIGTQHADTYVWEKETKDISDFIVSEVSDVIYAGSPKTPLPTVSDGMIDLIMDVDYTLSYQDNVNAGTGTIIITGIGFYTGTLETTFTINKAVPTVKELPSASIINKNDMLADSSLTGGSVSGVEFLANVFENVEGTFSWTSPEIIVNETNEFEVIFIPFSTNYESITLSVLAPLIEHPLKGTVRVTHKDEEGNELSPTVVLTGEEGALFETNAKDIVGWIVKNMPSNARGVFSKEPQTVAYVYKRADGAPVTVTYSDEEGNELAPAEVLVGKLSESFKTEPKNIKGWKLVRKPSNASGIFSKEAQFVKYEYEQEPFILIPAVTGKNENINYPQTGVRTENRTLFGILLFSTSLFLSLRMKKKSI